LLDDVFDGLEEGFLVVWGVWQILRLIMITRSHRQARQNAKHLINFENIVVDTEFG
jgi:hypothetical protein